MATVTDYRLVRDANGNTVTEAYQRQVDDSTVTAAANHATLVQNARTGLANNLAFLAIGSPTQAQAVAQVQALTRQIDGLARVVFSWLDDTT